MVSLASPPRGLRVVVLKTTLIASNPYNCGINLNLKIEAIAQFTIGVSLALASNPYNCGI